jgi:hypothetical protein
VAAAFVALGAAGLALLHPPRAVAASAPTAKAAVTRAAKLATVFDPTLLT